MVDLSWQKGKELTDKAVKDAMVLSHKPMKTETDCSNPGTCSQEWLKNGWYTKEEKYTCNPLYYLAYI